MNDDDRALLCEGELEILGRIVEASNATLLCTVTLGDRTAHAVYKPVRGEQPLWDFPDGTLAGRELAAYAVSEETGWGIIPPTVLRHDAPYGTGMLQLWMDGDEDVDLIELINSAPDSLRRMAVLDAVINNSDRKGGHIIVRPAAPDTPITEREVWGVDHGVSFSAEDKLRTLLWQWAGEPLTDEALEVLHLLHDALDADLGETLHEHLTLTEVRRTRARIESMVRDGTHPLPSADWPSVPYPPF
ncbi:SCO1664 family protein [Cumulibacter soli]|uniref:SCO1664 family protein n=1 Tax=Cumulibacter soli TaxID=2546344 RepID=UPI001FB9FBE8|nr:SCO1664 family protein [Cumulibacter soli]